MRSYSELQRSLDEVVRQIGLCNTLHLLKGFIGHLEAGCKQPSYQRALTAFITQRTLQEFDLDPEKLNDSQIPEYREARMVIFHLLRHYGAMTYAIIGEKFGGRPDHSVKYFIQRCEQELSVLHDQHRLVRAYRNIETALIDFISHHSHPQNNV